MRINVHAGHNHLAPGAYGIFSETKEDRAVKDRVIAKLQAAGHIVYDCTDEVGRTASENLANIVRKCNAHKVDLDVSIHFNAFNGAAEGVEVLCYDGGTHAVAGRILSAIAKKGYKNRGIKPGNWLYVLANTNDPALLIECCFCDNQHDANLYRAEQIADAIVEGITGRVVAAAQWIQNSVGWWYRYADGSFPANKWEQINGKWYYFDNKGYMAANQWIKYKEKWYWVDGSGAMQVGWVKPGPFWYYLNENGAMLTGWVGYGGKWYYLNPTAKDGLPEGAMMTGAVEVKGILYSMGSNGALEWEVDLKGGALKAIAAGKWEIEFPEKKSK